MIHLDWFREHREGPFVLARQTFDEAAICDSGAVYETLERVCHALPAGGVEMTMFFATTMRFDYLGQHVLRVGPRLGAAFSKLKFGDVKLVELNPPQAVTYVELLDSEIEILGNGAWKPINGVYLHHFAEYDALQLVAWAAPAPWEEHDNFAMFDVQLVQAQQMGLDKYFDKYLAKRLKNYGEGEGAQDPATAPRLHANFMKLARVAINAMLYYQSARPELKALMENSVERNRLKKKLVQTKAGSKKKKLRRRLDRVSRAQVEWLCPGYEAGPAGGDGQGAACLVSSRWHCYWVGPKHDLYGTSEVERGDGRRRVRVFVGEHWRESGGEKTRQATKRE